MQLFVRSFTPVVSEEPCARFHSHDPNESSYYSPDLNRLANNDPYRYRVVSGETIYILPRLINYERSEDPNSEERQPRSALRENPGPPRTRLPLL